MTRLDKTKVLDTDTPPMVQDNDLVARCVKPATPDWCEKKGDGAKLTCMPGISWFCTWTDPTYGSPAYAPTNMTCEGCNPGR